MTPTQQHLARIAREHGRAYAAPGTDGWRHWQDMTRQGVARQVQSDRDGLGKFEVKE